MLRDLEFENCVCVWGDRETKTDGGGEEVGRKKEGEGDWFPFVREGQWKRGHSRPKRDHWIGDSARN